MDAGAQQGRQPRVFSDRTPRTACRASREAPRSLDMICGCVSTQRKVQPQWKCKTERNVLNHVASLCYTLFGSPSRNTVPLGPTEEDVAELLGVWGLLKRQTPTWAACAPGNGGTGRAAAWQACRCGRRTSTITARLSAGSTLLQRARARSRARERV